MKNQRLKSVPAFGAGRAAEIVKISLSVTSTGFHASRDIHPSNDENRRRIGNRVKRGN